MFMKNRRYSLVVGLLQIHVIPPPNWGICYAHPLKVVQCDMSTVLFAILLFSKLSIVTITVYVCPLYVFFIRELTIKTYWTKLKWINYSLWTGMILAINHKLEIFLCRHLDQRKKLSRQFFVCWWPFLVIFNGLLDSIKKINEWAS